MNALVEIESLIVRYGRRRVLDRLSLEVPTGSVTALLGANGAGKTTLLKALTGELRPREGRARVLGLDPRRARKQVLRGVGWVPERTDLPRWMTVADHLRFLAPFFPTWDRDEAERLLTLFQLDADARYAELSKGQRALENLTCALAHKPRLLLLDEPFSGLDPFARRSVFDGVLEHLREEDRGVLLVSHSLADVERCADRVALLLDGRIAFTGSLDEALGRAARITVRLAASAVDWVPPGQPLVEHEGTERVLFYLDFDAETSQALERDPAVEELKFLPRDLEDVVLALRRREVAA